MASRSTSTASFFVESLSLVRLTGLFFVTERSDHNSLISIASICPVNGNALDTASGIHVVQLLDWPCLVRVRDIPSLVATSICPRGLLVAPVTCIQTKLQVDLVQTVQPNNSFPTLENAQPLWYNEDCTATDIQIVPLTIKNVSMHSSKRRSDLSEFLLMPKQRSQNKHLTSSLSALTRHLTLCQLYLSPQSLQHWDLNS